MKAKSELQTLRKAAIEAIDAFIGYVEVMATTPKQQRGAAPGEGPSPVEGLSKEL